MQQFFVSRKLETKKFALPPFLSRVEHGDEEDFVVMSEIGAGFLLLCTGRVQSFTHTHTHTHTLSLSLFLLQAITHTDRYKHSLIDTLT
jgi:hypothetical protein